MSTWCSSSTCATQWPSPSSSSSPTSSTTSPAASSRTRTVIPPPRNRRRTHEEAPLTRAPRRAVFTVHTLGNVRRLNSGYGAVELVIACVLIYFVYGCARELRKAASQGAKDREKDAVEARSIMIYGLPKEADESEVGWRLASAGAPPPTSVHVALDVSAHAAHEAKCEKLQEAVQKAQLKVIGCDRDRRRAIEKGRDGEKEAAKGAKAKLALNEARDALEAHRASAPPPATEKTGVAFATFGKEEDASAALQALADFGRRPRPRGAPKLTADWAPPPSEVRWGHLHISWRERALRLFASTFVTFLLSLIGTGVIALCAFLQNDQSIFGYATSADDDFGDVVWRLFISQAISARSPGEMLPARCRSPGAISVASRPQPGCISGASRRILSGARDPDHPRQRAHLRDDAATHRGDREAPHNLRDRAVDVREDDLLPGTRSPPRS